MTIKLYGVLRCSVIITSFIQRQLRSEYIPLGLYQLTFRKHIEVIWHVYLKTPTSLTKSILSNMHIFPNPTLRCWKNGINMTRSSIHIGLQWDKGNCTYAYLCFHFFLLKYTCRQESLCSHNGFMAINYLWNGMKYSFSMFNSLDILPIYKFQHIIFNNKITSVIITASVVTSETTEDKN